MDRHNLVTTTALALAASALAACGGSGSSGGAESDGLVSTPKSVLELKEPQTCSAFNDYVTKALTGLMVNGGFTTCPDCVETAVGGAVAQPGLGTDQESFDSFTGTNNQEAGVDELDQIEADANGFFYLIDGTQLVVANGLPPADLRAVAKLELGVPLQPVEHGTLVRLPDDGLVLDADNHRLVIARSTFDPLLPDVDGPGIVPRPINPLTELVFVNVADPTAPVIERRLRIEGFRLAVRRIGARVHVVTHATPFMPLPLANDAQLATLRQQLASAPAGSELAQGITEQIRGRVAALVAATDPLDYLPNLSVSTGEQPFTDITPTDCSDVALPDVAMPLALTTVTSVDSDGTGAASLTLPIDSWNVYASAKDVYLPQTKWWFARDQRQETAIYKIEIGASRPVYRALGVVGGWTDSSFEFSELEGFLRVATNRSEFDPSAGAWLRDNHLYVLGDDGAGSLSIVGNVGFAAGERIFATRFLGTRGFVVTFRQIDPLFAFDLSVPQDPRLVGQLDIPGVSTYLHPLDDAHLLTIGFDGDQNRLNGQFELQIFDVQDLSDPRLLYKFVPKFEAPGFAWTSATNDHLAFNYFPEGGTLTVPVQYWATNASDHFSGFIAFSVSVADGFAELGRLDHSDLARAQYCSTSTGVPPVWCTDGHYIVAAQPRRAVSAQLDGKTYIYTLSNAGMKVSAAPTFGTAIATLPLPGGNNYWWWVPQP
jgi:hypothetical protein